MNIRRRWWILFAVLTVIFYWLLDAFVDYYFFGFGSFSNRLLHPDGEEIWMRSFASGLLLVFVMAMVIHLSLIRKHMARLQEAQALGRLVFWEWDMSSSNLYQTGNSQLVTGLAPPPADYPDHLQYLLDEIVHPDDRERVLQSLNKAMAGDDCGTFDFEHRIKTPDGGIRWSRARGNVVRDASGKLILMRGVVQDISEYKQLQLAQEENELKYRQLVEDTNVMAWEVDPLTRRFSYVSPQVERIFGYTQKEWCTPGFWTDHLHPEDRDEAIEHGLEAIRTKRDHAYEYRMIKADGTIIWLSNIGRMVLDTQGKVVKIMGVMVDVSRLKDTEQALRESGAMLQAFYDNSLVGMSTTNMEKDWTQVNDKCTEITGYPAEELTIDKWLEITHPDDREASAALRQRMLDGEVDTYTVEKRYIRKDGETIYANLCVEALRDVDGSIKHTIGFVLDITESKRAEAALRRNEQQLRTFFENDLIGMCIVDVNKHITHANAAYCRMLGYSLEEIKTLSRLDITHPDDIAESVSAWEQIFTGQIDSYYLDKRFVRKDGEIVYALSYGECVRNADGSVNYMLAFVQDISKLKKAQQTLEQYSHIVSSATDMLALIDRDFTYLAVNDAYCRRWGLTREAIVGRRIPEIHGEEAFRQVIKPHVEPCLRGENINYQDWITFPQTGRRCMDITYTPFRAAGVITAYVVCARDITALVKAEEALERFFEQPTSLNMIAGLDGEIKRVNRGWEQQLGYTRRELEGSNYLDLVHPEDQQATREQMGLLNDGKSFDFFENRYRDKQGNYRLLTWSAAAIAEEGIIFGIARDNTERRNLEQQLLQSQKMETVGQLTGGIAHDFNNILAIIRGNLELLENLLQDDEQRAARVYLKKLLTNVERGTNLTQRLLAFSHKQLLAPVTVNLNQHCRELLELLQSTLGNTIEISLEPGTDLWNCYIDPTQLEHVLINLALNARAAMPEGGSLVIETRNIELDEIFISKNRGSVRGEYIMMAVIDDGKGMSDEVKVHAFEPFFTTKEKGKGTGLGLSIAYNFTKQAGGYISIDSQLGEGTAIRIYFPRYHGPVTADSHQILPARKSSVNATILLVEDELELQEVVSSQLRNLGYTVLCAQDGKTAIDTIENNQTIDLLLTDIILPCGIYGNEIASRALVNGLRVLYMSGYTDNEMDKNGRFPGDDAGLLRKPFSLEELAMRVSEVLNQAARPSQN